MFFKFCFAGTMALYIVVVVGSKLPRLDDPIHSQIVSLVYDGKPTLVCMNQMDRWYKDYCPTANRTAAQCDAIKNLIIKDASGACGLLDVCATELVHYDDKIKERDVKGLEYVSSHTVYTFHLLQCAKHA